MTNLIDLMGKEINATFNTGLEVRGTVCDVSVNQRYVWIEMEDDSLCLDIQKVTIEVIEPAEVVPAEVVPAEDEETVVIAETERLIELKEAVKQVEKLIRYQDEYEIKVQVYDCDEDNYQTYDVEIRVTDESNETEWICTDRYGTEKEALRRAKHVRKTLAKHFENIVEGVEVYGL